MPNRLLSRFLLPVLLVAAIGAASGCDGEFDYRPAAMGEEGVVSVVMDSAAWAGQAGEALRGQLAQDVMTLPVPEPAFQLRHVPLRTQKDLDQVQQLKNVVIAAPLSDSTAVARFLRARLDAQSEQAVLGGRSALIRRPDLWRRNQLIVYLIAPNDSSLADVIRAQGPALRDGFNEITRARLTTDMFNKGRQEDLEKVVMDRHGFAVNVQHDYFIGIDTTQFVWLRRVLSDTWRSLFIYYTDDVEPAEITPEWIYQTRDSLSRRYLQGNLGDWVEIDHRRPLTTEQIDFGGRYGFETRGLWHMVGLEDGEKRPFGMGGPFVTYAFYDQAAGRTYVIDGMVFAPGFEKREFLRQMEVIAHTFRTRSESPPPAVSDNR